MTDKYIFTLEVARKAYRDGTLFEKVQEYLRSEGWNKGLADNLIQGKPTITTLTEFPLRKLKRIMGPEDTMNYREATDTWEERVSNLRRVIRSGISLPPLIVTDFWKDLELADGSHRHEALVREGYEKYWTIFFFKKAESLDLLG